MIFLLNDRDVTSSTGSKVSSRRLCLHLLHWLMILSSTSTALHLDTLDVAAKFYFSFHERK